MQISAAVAVVAGALGFVAGRQTFVTDVKPEIREAATSPSAPATGGFPLPTSGSPAADRAVSSGVINRAASGAPLPIGAEEFRQEIEAIQNSGWGGLSSIRRTSLLAERIAVSNLRELAAGVTNQPNQMNHGMGVYLVLTAYADQDAEAAWQLASALPPGQDRQSAMHAVSTGIAEKDPQRALALAESLDDAQSRTQIRSQVISQLAAKDPREAMKLYLGARAEDSTPGHDGTISIIFHHWARRDLEGAKVAAAELTGNDADQAVSTLISAFANADPKAAWEYARTLPSGSNDHGDPKSRVIQMWSMTDPQAALEAAATIDNASVRDSAVSNALSAWARSDFDAALNYALTLQNPIGRSDALRSLSGSAGANREQMLTAVLDYMPPGSSFQQAVSQIFSSWGNDNPRQAAEAIFRLPPGQIFSNAASQVASQWSRTGTKSEVLGWVRKLPEGEIRLNSVDAVFKQWATDDLSAAQSAMAGLNATERSRAVRAIGDGWSQKDPEAALRWASSLTNDEDRRDVVRNAINHMARMSPESAARKVESLPAGERGPAIQAVVSQWASRDATSAGEWLARQPVGDARDGAITTLARTLAAENPEDAITWASQISNERNRTRQLENHARTWIRNEPQTARAFVASSNQFTEEMKERLLRQ